MASRTRSRSTPVSSLETAALQHALHSLGDFAHVAVRAAPIGADQYGLSFHNHTGRWESPYLARADFSGGVRGSGH